MTTLSIGLSILLTIGLLILLVPLAMKSQLNTDKTAKMTLIGIAVFVPVFSIAGYFALGTPEFAEVSTEQAAPQMTTLVDKLEEKLAKKPKDFNGWLLLGRSYMVTEDYHKAVLAFEKAILIQPNSLKAILPLADATALTQAGNLEGRPYQLLQQAYTIDPQHQMTLWLLGMAEKQLGKSELAAQYWNTLFSLLPDSSKDKRSVQKLLASVGKEVSYTETTETHEKAIIEQEMVKTDKKITEGNIKIKLNFDAKLLATTPNATLFIYVKETVGPPMPIAAQRYSVQNIPINITINKKDELMPNRSIKDFESLTVGVKLSNGDAVSQQTLFKKEEITDKVLPVEFSIEF